jgi:hypothetical protein
MASMMSSFVTVELDVIYDFVVITRKLILGDSFSD